MVDLPVEVLTATFAFVIGVALMPFTAVFATLATGLVDVAAVVSIWVTGITDAATFALVYCL